MTSVYTLGERALFLLGRLYLREEVRIPSDLLEAMVALFKEKDQEPYAEEFRLDATKGFLIDHFADSVGGMTTDEIDAKLRDTDWYKSRAKAIENTGKAMDRYRAALHDVRKMCSLESYQSVGPVLALETIDRLCREALPPHNDPDKVSEHYGGTT